jgi:hypothetical protein
MKWKLLMVTLLIGISSIAQSNLSVLPASPKFGTSKAQFNAAKFSANLANSMKSDHTIIVYNSTTGMTNAYTNGFAATFSNAALLSQNLLRGIKVDSFNPNGACSFGEAVGDGLLNLIFCGNKGLPFNLR